jgi:hypothetical protein
VPTAPVGIPELACLPRRSSAGKAILLDQRKVFDRDARGASAGQSSKSNRPGQTGDEKMAPGLSITRTN